MLLRITRTRKLCLSAIAAVGLATAAGSSHADEYRLGVDDKLTIKVVEWQMIENQFREWTSVGGEYTVQAGGAISLPFAGAIAAQGLTTEELSQSISAALKQKLGLKTPPEASVGIAQYRPFFVAGGVQSPGQYPYVPGLTAEKALAIAGGPFRRPEGQTANALITARANSAVLANQRARLLVRAARIEAQAAGKDAFDTPRGLGDANTISGIVAEETAILATQRKKLGLRIEALANLKQLLVAEVESLEKKQEVQQRQIALTRKELEGLETLAAKGLTPNSRVFGSERSVADMESKGLDLEALMLRAKQDISKADQDTIDAQNSASADLAIERNRTEADLAEATHKLEMQSDLIVEALRDGPTTLIPLQYTVSRQKPDGGSVTLQLSSTDPVLPGDVVTISPGEAPTR